MGHDALIILGIGIGVGVGVLLTCVLACVFGFLGDVFHAWTEGRDLYRLVTESRHKRQLELLDKLIELERARNGSPG